MKSQETRRGTFRGWGWGLILTCSFALFHIGRCAADDSITLLSEPATESIPEPTLEFPKGTWTIDTFAAWGTQPNGTPDQFWSGAAGINLYVLDNFSAGWEFTGFFIPQKDLDANGVGGALSFRYHLIRGDGWTIFPSLALGLAEFNHRVPEPTETETLGGTDFNFTLAAGLGGTIRLTDNTDLMLGLRYFHISNAGAQGIHRNPSVNATQGYLGLMFKL
jgi:hypothetical protein